MKTVYVGKEGSGKTLLLGRESERLVYRNVFLAKKTGYMRPLISNISYSPQFIKFATSKGVPVKQWRHISELELFTEADILIDEIGAYFDSRTFADLPLSTRLWLAQAQKLGVHIYGGAQDWAQIDISFRRLVSHLYEIRRIFGSRRPSKSIPGSKHPFAVAFRWRLDPNGAAETTDAKSLSVIPALIVMTKRDTDRFDTNARVAMSDPPPLRKVVRVCPEDGYKRIRYI